METYDKYIVAFSGGKDSIACFLHLLDLGIPKDKIELWHQLVDGKGESFMDWEITEDYCRKFAQAFHVPIYFSYKEGGFEREMLRNGTATAPTYFENENHEWISVGGKGKPGTRRKFPQVTVDLSTRYCSPYLKIDICAMAIRNQSRFEGIKTVVLSGERGEESKARANYAILEIDRAGLTSRELENGTKEKIRVANRWVDRWRPVRDWTEEQVWDTMRRYRVMPHPCYRLGYSRCSCKFCIFGNADQFKTSCTISPIQGNKITLYEEEFGVTIKRKESVRDLLNKGSVYYSVTDELVALATGYTYYESIILPEGEEWVLPAGAFKKDGCGPT